MAFTVKDVRDLTQLLGTHPEWLTEVRRLVLTDELLTLPGLVRELAAAQVRTEQRLERLEVVVADLAEAQKRTEQQLSELAAAQKRTEQALAALTDAQRRTSDIVDQLLGRDLERKYGTSPWDRERAGAYFGKWLKPVEVISPNDLREALEARLRADEVDEVMLADVLIRGRLRQRESMPEVWLVLEVSHVIDRYDVDRAQKRAALLRQAGYHAMPVVAGERMLEECEGTRPGGSGGGVSGWQSQVLGTGSRSSAERGISVRLRFTHPFRRSPRLNSGARLGPVLSEVEGMRKR